jgi:addiction module HigA family antidote
MIENGSPFFHPEDFLVEILDELEITQAQFARAIGFSPIRISHIVKHTRPVTAELALRFGQANQFLFSRSKSNL